MPRESHHGEPRHEHGFTLLEVMVALAIAALALTVLYRGALGSLFLADTAGRYQEALARARSRLAGVGPNPMPGDFRGQDGGVFRWRLRIVPLGAAALPQPMAGAAPAPQVVLYGISVAESWTVDGHTRSVRLDSQRLGLAAAEGP